MQPLKTCLDDFMYMCARTRTVLCFMRGNFINKSQPATGATYTRCTSYYCRCGDVPDTEWFQNVMRYRRVSYSATCIDDFEIMAWNGVKGKRVECRISSMKTRRNKKLLRRSSAPRNGFCIFVLGKSGSVLKIIWN